jgi:hypothetical protein
MNTSAVDNADMKVRFYDGTETPRGFLIYPHEGYVIHSTQYDAYARDPETLEDTDVILPGFIPYPSFVGAEGDYDFTAVVNDVYTYTDENGIEVSIPIRKVGTKEFYCVPIGIVPDNQIYDINNPPVVASTEPETETN